MADQDKKISELTETTNPASTDVLPISTDSTTYKVSADNLISKTTLTGLQTTATTVAGAINELKQGQSSATLSGLTDVDISSPSAEEVLKYNSTTQKWENGVGGRTYTAGANVQISNENVISATDTKYSAGTNIQISGQNAISATIPTASASNLGGVKVGTGLEIDNNGVLSASGGTDITKTVSGNICSFSTSFAGPLKSLTAKIVATGGNGTPDNPNPINGYTEANITRCGVNLYSDIFNEYRKPFNYFIKDVPLEVGKQYTLKASLKDGGTAVSGCALGVVRTGEQYTEFGNWFVVLNTAGNAFTITFTVDSTFTSPKLAFYVANETQFNSLFENYDIMLVEGTDTTYHAYNGQTYTIAFGQTVYGGVLDVTRGKLKPCIEYPSYNGETLSDRWLSSEATYIEGTTPPTGSQVVSLDDYGIDIDLTPVQISALASETNNIMSDLGGDVEVRYVSGELAVQIIDICKMVIAEQGE